MPDDKHDFVSTSIKIKDAKLSLPEVSSGGENTHQDPKATLLEINQGLISAVQQKAETTTVMKAIMLQRQEIPKPQAIKFKGDPSQFPVFKK